VKLLNLQWVALSDWRVGANRRLTEGQGPLSVSIDPLVRIHGRVMQAARDIIIVRSFQAAIREHWKRDAELIPEKVADEKRLFQKGLLGLEATVNAYDMNSFQKSYFADLQAEAFGNPGANK
jgi:hypothetical protein